jgi:hypothetical protein
VTSNVQRNGSDSAPSTFSTRSTTYLPIRFDPKDRRTFKRCRRSMRIFHRSKILRLSGWIYEDAISARYQCRVGPREKSPRKTFGSHFASGEEQVFTSIVVASNCAMMRREIILRGLRRSSKQC